MLQRLALYLLAALAGASTVLAFAPHRLYWVALLALTVLVLLLQRWPQRAFGIGWSWGVAAYTSQFYWIYISLHDIAGMPSPLAAGLTLLLPMYLALYPGLASWLSVRMHDRPAVRWLLLFPAAWTLGEWLRSWVLTGFPWGAIGYSQITESPLAGLAPVGGIHAVTLAVALSAGILGLLPQAGLHAARRAALGGLLLALWGSAAWLQQQTWTTPAGPAMRVALLQGNIPQALKWDPATFDFTLATYYRMVVQAPAADMTLLPETALPVFLDDLPSGYLTMVNGVADRKRTTLVTGIPRRTPDGRGYLNAVIALNQPTQDYYAKNHLVPFGEFIPLPAITGWLYRFMNMPLAGFTPGGDHQPPLTIGQQKVAFNICYEDGFGEELIGPAAKATILANVSNLAWFGKSHAMSQHLQLSQARALETGRPMLRATNTGMTAVVAPDGRVQAVLPPFTRGALVAEVRGYQGLTPFARTGNTVALFLATLLLAAGALARRRETQ